MEYCIITKRELVSVIDVDQLLVGQVNKRIELGWKPIGGVSCCYDTIGGLHVTYSQAMVKENKLLKESK